MKKTALFLGLTCLINWGLALAFYMSGRQFTGTTAMIFGALYMLIPMIVVIIVQKFIYKEELQNPLMISFKFNKWFLLVLIPPVVSILSIFLNLLIPGVSYAPDMAGLIERYAASIPADQLQKLQEQLHRIPFIALMAITLIQGIGLGATVNAVFAFGEELGWRGFLVNQLRSMHFMKASLIIGFIWGVWHFPLILMGHNYPQHPVIGVFLMIIFCMLLSPLFLFLVIKTKSVIAAAMMHGVMNGTAALSIMAIKGGNDLTIGITGVAGFITIVIAVGVLIILDSFVWKEKIMMKTMEEGLESKSRK